MAVCWDRNEREGQEKDVADRQFIFMECVQPKDHCLCFPLYCSYASLPPSSFVPCSEEGLPLSLGSPRWMNGLQACTFHQLSPVLPCHTFVKTNLCSLGSQNLGITNCFSCHFFGLLHLCIPASHSPLSVFHRCWSLCLCL